MKPPVVGAGGLETQPVVVRVGLSGHHRPVSGQRIGPHTDRFGRVSVFVFIHRWECTSNPGAVSPLPLTYNIHRIKVETFYSPSPEYPAACWSEPEIPPSGAAGYSGEGE